MRSAIATRAAGYIAMFALLALAGALAAKRIPHLVARMSIVALLTAAVTGGYFWFAAPPINDAHMGPGVYLLLAGVVLGFAATILVMRSNADVSRR